MPKIEITVNKPDHHIQALVHGARGYGRTFVVDHWPDLYPGPPENVPWLCTCGHAPGCSHIRAVRSELQISDPQEAS